MADPVTTYQHRGKDWVALICECGQQQQSPDNGEHKITCARCGKEHSVNG